MPAESADDASSSGHPWGWAAAASLALLLATGLAILWIKAPDLYRGQGGATEATATTRGGTLTLAAALVAATAAGAGLRITARTLRETQRANREAEERS